MSVQLAERGSTASFLGKECLQVASVGRSVVHQKAQPDFSPIWAGTQSAVSNRGSVVWRYWVKLFFLPVFEMSAIKEKTTTLCHMSTWHVSNLQTFNLSNNSDASKETFLFFRWKGFGQGLFFLQKKEKNGQNWKNLPEKWGPHKLTDGGSGAISLTTAQQKSSHALDKGA